MNTLNPIMARSLIFLILVSIFCVCKRNPSPAELIEKFNGNKIYLDSLAASLKQDKKFDSFFHYRLDLGLPDIKNTYPKQFELIRKAGLIEISSNPVCRICPRWYYIKTNWISEYPIYLIYNSRQDSMESEKGFYKIDKYLNETWGLGDNWRMFRFVDTIRDVKY